MSGSAGAAAPNSCGSLVCAELRFVARLADKEHGLRFLGPTLRGAFGYTLKRTVCQVAHGRCSCCVLRGCCPYTLVFEGEPPPFRTVMRRYPTAPQPFVLIVGGPAPLPDDADRIEWGIRLFGPSIDLWPYVALTFQRIGERGLGPRHVRYTLEQIRDGADERELWDGGGATIGKPHVLPVATGNRPPAGPVCWRFHTPVHVRSGGKRNSQIDGLSLVLAGRRRWKLISSLFGCSENSTSSQVGRSLPDFSSSFRARFRGSPHIRQLRASPTEAC